MGELAGNLGDRAEIFAGPRNGGDGGRIQGVSCSRCSLQRNSRTCWRLSARSETWAAALEGTERGKKVMSRQMYKIKQEIADHERVALEV
jgi:hypothetical protein